MNSLQALLAAAAAGVVLVAYRESLMGHRPAPARGIEGGYEVENEEPVLGYDGMDQDTLLDWLADARLSRATLARIRRYEAGNLGRRPVMEAVDDLL